MKIINLLALSFLPRSLAFVAAPTKARITSLLHSTDDDVREQDTSNISRRNMLWKAGAVASLSFVTPFAALADDVAESSSGSAKIAKVVVAGATGQTGSRIYSKLLSDATYTATGGVRNVGKASKALGNADNLKHLDVVEDSLDSLVATLKGADGLVIACGMNPGKNLLRMSAAAHEVDNVGTCKLIDAAKKAGVKKIVLVSSILTNGRNWGQEDSPGFKITNAFGGALDEKLAAEIYLRSSGLDYTIVRPGGLQAKPPTGALSINKEDTLNSGEISRDLVADVCIACLNDASARNKVLEIIEDDGTPPKVFNGLNM